MKGTKERGITLVSLVVTIVILVILAGITIVQLTGENGLLEKSIVAKEEIKEKEAEEVLNFKITECHMKSYIEKKTNGDITIFS